MLASPVATRFPSSARQIDRRTVLRAFVASGLIGAGHPVVSRAQEGTPAALALFAGETFVGETSDPATLVAISWETGPEESRVRHAAICAMGGCALSTSG